MFFRSVFFLTLIFFTNAYIFKCVGDCECDTDDETIHCHNKADREVLQLPEKRLRGFHYIGMTNNDIRVLPSEEMLLEKFPELQAVDVEGNINFDCSTLPHYTKVQVLSDCDKKPDEIMSINVYDVKPADEDCDSSCQLKRHYDSLHAYVIKLWEMLKEKFEVINKTQLVTDIRQWFAEIMANLRNNNA
uniref:Uncharacterized protein n=1 Tax=Panagrolaimus sp. JU765 TaxID=591449 RepID=A0AC34Q6G5_9BILA